MRLFVTGTDTGVGKTVATGLLLRALERHGVKAIGMKPVAAGINAAGAWDDVEFIRAATRAEAPIDEVAPYRLRAPASPHFAAREDGVSIELPVILAALERLERRAECVVIEGVGGFRVPLSETLDTATMARAIGAPVVMVVAMRLGCINHALLTAEAIAARGLELAAWVANAGIDPDYPRLDRTIETLCANMRSPCAGVLPRLADATRPQDGPIDLRTILQRLDPPSESRRAS